MGQCLVAWRGGKASTIEADLEISRGAAQTVRFHIKSDDGDPRLLEALVHRLGAGNLEFELGRASTGGVVHDALLARLGYGVVAVRDLDGDLAINLSGSPAVTRVGNAIVGQQSPYPVPSEEGCVGGGVEARQSGE